MKSLKYFHVTFGRSSSAIVVARTANAARAKVTRATGEKLRVYVSPASFEQAVLALAEQRRLTEQKIFVLSGD